MPEHRLRILHLSDLHERVALEWMDEQRKAKVRLSEADRRRVLDDSNFLQILREEVGPVHLVCFTGDVADWGLKDEFDKATSRLDRILEAAKTTRERLFLVPGNHDIQRMKAAAAWNAMRQFGARYESANAFSKWMAGDEVPPGAEAAWRDDIGQRTAEFWNWVERGLDRAVLLPRNHAHGRLGYNVAVEGLDFPFRVYVLGFDSAWLCGDDNDAGKLRLTPGQVKLLARDSDAQKLCGFRLALVHHPLSDLGDGRECRGLLAETADLLLHGHQHDPLSEISVDPDRQLIVMATGSLYADEGDRWINSFHTIDAFLDDEGRPLRYRVTFWGWSDKGHWYRTGAIYEKAKDGSLEFPVRAHGRGDEAVAAVSGAGVAPELQPWYYVHRSVESEVRNLILKARGNAPVAVIGMPGAGKSTLVASLVQDPAVREDYPGGVLWATLGSEAAQTTTHLGRFLQSLGLAAMAGDIQRQLADQLKTRSCLLVLDDVWEHAAIAPFRACLGHACGLVITTRDRAVAEAVEALTIEVGPMKPDEAQALIVRLLGRALSKEEQASAIRVAAAVGYLPLSLRLVCARINEGESWDRLHSLLEDEDRRLFALEPPEESGQEESRKQRSIAATFNLSLQRLGAPEREAFGLLSLLAEDVSFTPEVAASLWSTTADGAELRLRRLFRKGLLLAAEDSKAARRLFAFHDEQRNAARRLLGCPVPTAHSMLLDLYAQRRASPSWSSLPDDGYIHDHMAWHLIRAGRTEELHDLLHEGTNGANAWFMAREDQRDGYLRDLESAAAESTEPARQLGYALMESSVGSLGINLPWGVVEELLRRKAWRDERSFQWALSLPPSRRFATLAELAAVVSEPSRTPAFDAALEDLRRADEPEPNGKIWMFQSLPVEIPESRLEAVLRAAKDVKVLRSASIIWALRHFAALGRFEEMRRELESLDDLDPGLLMYLAPLLPVDQLEWLQAASRHQPDVAAAVALRLARLGEPGRALDLIVDCPEAVGGRTIEEIAGELDEGHLRRAEILAEKMSDAVNRSRALAAIYSAFREPERSSKLEALWSKFRRDYSKEAERAVRFVIPHLTGPLVKEYVESVLPGEDEETLALAKRLAQLGKAEEAAELVERFGELGHRNAMEQLAPFFDEKQLLRFGVTDPEHDPIALSRMLPRWAELGHGEEAVNGWTRLRGTYFSFRDKAAAAIAPHLDAAQLDRLRAECEVIGDRPAQLRFLVELAIHAPSELAPSLFDAELESAVAVEAIARLSSALGAQAALEFRASLTSPVKRLAVSSALNPPPEEIVIDDLQAVYQHLREEKNKAKGKPLSDVWDVAAVAAETLKYFAVVLKATAGAQREPVLALGRVALNELSDVLRSPEEFVAFWPGEDIQNAVMRHDWSDRRIPSLANVAAILTQELAGPVEDLVLRLGSKTTEIDFLEKLTAAPRLTGRLLDVASTMGQAEGARETYLSWSGPRLAKHLAQAGRVQEAVEIARLSRKYANHDLRALVALGEYLPTPHHTTYLEEAWRRITVARYTRSSQNEASLLQRLSRRAVRRPGPALDDLWHSAVRFLGSQSRPDVWDYAAALAPVLHALAGAEGVVAAWQAARDVSRWWR